MTTAAIANPPINAPGAARLWRMKGLIALALLVWVCVPYYGLQYISLRAAYEMPATALDRAVPFHIAWAGVYLSLYLLIPLAPVLYTSARDLSRFTIAMAVMSAIAFVFFLVWPTTVPRPSVPSQTFLYDMITRFDRPRNACPSLHAAFAVLAVLSFEPLLRARSSFTTWSVRASVWLWAGVILYATLATRQHVLIDLAAGGVLGSVIWFACRRFANERRDI
jgi:membrane-associated phospholipid phosphatase